MTEYELSSRKGKQDQQKDFTMDRWSYGQRYQISASCAIISWTQRRGSIQFCPDKWYAPPIYHNGHQSFIRHFARWVFKIHHGTCSKQWKNDSFLVCSKSKNKTSQGSEFLRSKPTVFQRRDGYRIFVWSLAKANQVDPNIDFNWGQTNPTTNPNILVGSFSARWTGYIKMNNTETYTFTTNCDYGVSLQVGSIQVISQWGSNASYYSGVFTLFTIHTAANCSYCSILCWSPDRERRRGTSWHSTNPNLRHGFHNQWNWTVPWPLLELQLPSLSLQRTCTGML